MMFMDKLFFFVKYTFIILQLAQYLAGQLISLLAKQCRSGLEFFVWAVCDKARGDIPECCTLVFVAYQELAVPGVVLPHNSRERNRDGCHRLWRRSWPCAGLPWVVLARLWSRRGLAHYSVFETCYAVGWDSSLPLAAKFNPGGPGLMKSNQTHRAWRCLCGFAHIVLGSVFDLYIFFTGWWNNKMFIEDDCCLSCVILRVYLLYCIWWKTMMSMTSIRGSFFV